MIIDCRENFISYYAELAEHKGLFVPAVGREQTEPKHEYVSTRKYYLFHFVIKGKGKYYVGGKTYSLAKNYGFIIEPGVETRYVADDLDPWEYCWIAVNGLDVIDFLETAELFNKHYFSYEPEFIAPLLALTDELRVNPKMNPDYISLRVNAVFLEIMSCFVPKNTQKAKIAVGVNSLAISGAEYFKKHFTENIGVNEAAAALHISRVYFSTLFTKEIGITPKEYLTELKIDAAKRMLVSDSLTLKAIASKCGFNDVAVFSKCFKKIVGKTPYDYKKSIT